MGYTLANTHVSIKLTTVKSFVLLDISFCGCLYKYVEEGDYTCGLLYSIHIYTS